MVPLPPHGSPGFLKGKARKMAEKVKAEVLKRFNHRDPGDVDEFDPADFEKWAGMGLLKETKKTPGKAKTAEGPPEDKAVKEPGKKK